MTPQQGTLNFELQTLNFKLLPAYSLGTYKFTADEESAVIFRTINASGNIHLDAVQILPAK